jgi:hypothetical protein
MKSVFVFLFVLMGFIMLTSCSSSCPRGLEINYEDNEELWNLRQDNGITEQTPLAVDFQFISKEKESAAAFSALLEKRGFEVTLHEPGELIAGKYRNVTATSPTQIWTLEKLNNQAKELKELAEKHGCTIDGIGAMIDP